MPLPLPHWFAQSHSADNTEKVSYLENFLAYIRNNATDNDNVHLNELKQRNFYKPHGRTQYTTSMISYALQLHYTPLQANRLLLENISSAIFTIVI